MRNTEVAGKATEASHLLKIVAQLNSLPHRPHHPPLRRRLPDHRLAH